MAETNEKVLGRYEMLWDCSFCGKTRLLGITHRHCPECGAPQDQTKRYFPTDAEKVAVADDYAGTDRVCASCGSATSAKATFCVKCGAPLDEAAAAKRRSDQVVEKGRAFAADDAIRAAAELGDQPRPAPAPKKKSRWWIWALLVVAVLGVAIWFFFVRKRSADFEVAERRWERSVVIEEYRDVEKEAWQERVPSGARTLSCRDKQADTRKIPDGEDCQVRRVDKGDGTFEEREECRPKYREEPIMKPWCRYTVLEWTKVDEKTAATTDGSEPAWPATGVQPAQQARGARREGARNERFEIDLVEKGGRKHTCAVGRSLWDKLPAGAAAKGEVRARSGDIVCDTISAK